SGIGQPRAGRAQRRREVLGRWRARLSGVDDGAVRRHRRDLVGRFRPGPILAALELVPPLELVRRLLLELRPGLGRLRAYRHLEAMAIRVHEVDRLAEAMVLRTEHLDAVRL